MKTKLLAVLAIAAVSALLAQGPLTPPGARTPIDTAHTPGDASNEFIIDQRGSYALTSMGFDVLSIRNIIMRNTAGANSNANYSIVGGNTEGPIVNVVGVGDISGTASANTPMANFQY